MNNLIRLKYLNLTIGSITQFRQVSFRIPVAIIKLAVLIAFCGSASTNVNAQSSKQIIDELNAVNNKVTQTPCGNGKGMLISNKAMNIFLSNKVSSYLSDEFDLSLYKNYVTLNSAAGSISINHNFHQPVDNDDWVRSFLIIGARANIANTYAAKFSGRYFDNQLGFVLKKVWMGRPVTSYDNCNGQKAAMDARRALLLHALEADIYKQVDEFEHSVSSIKAAEVPGQDLQQVREKMRADFYQELKQQIFQKFSAGQSETLINTNQYKMISDNWTTAGIYIPIIQQKFEVMNAGNNQPASHANYPFEFYLTHTRFWDIPKTGRIFFTLSAKSFLNNSAAGGQMTWQDAAMVYSGDYRNYLTPVLAGKLVYLPPDSHVGVSFRIEKNFGSYHAINSIVGIPIVLIDKKGVPAVNFECQLLFSNTNMSHQNILLHGNKTAVGLTLGIPFSKIVY